MLQFEHMFGLEHVSTLLIYISNVLKDFIRFSEVVIRDH